MHSIPTRPCLYTRLSWAPDGSEEKVERQADDGRAVGSRLGWPPFCCVYTDNSRSAWQRNRKRPDWDRMLATMDASGRSLIPGDPKADHIHDGIMTYHGDRLIRQPYDLEVLLNLAYARDLPLASVTGVRNLNNADDRFILRIEAAQACRSSDDTSRRVKRGHAALAEKGLPAPGGKRPFGFEKDRITRREDECAIAAECAAKILAGLGTAGAVRWMNDRCRTTQGGMWTTKTLVHYLRSPRVAGLIERDGVLMEGAWRPVLDDDRERAVTIWEELKARFNASVGAHPYRGNERKHLLSGVAECGCCGGLVKVKPSSGPRAAKDPERRLLYFCPFCLRIGRNTYYTDRWVGGHAVQWLNDRRFIREIEGADPASSSLGAEVADLERRRAQTKEQLASLADNPDVDPSLAVLALSSFDRKISDLRARLAQAAGEWALLQLAGISADAWERAPVDLKSAAVRRMFTVTILPAPRPGPGFDETSVRVLRRPLRAQADAGAEHRVDDDAHAPS